jgi:hypothetical protein
MTVRRLDTLRHTALDTIKLLRMVYEEAEDLHVLAYDRPSAVEEAKVSGGSPNYALDTHGDLDARKAYKELWDRLDGTCIALNEASNKALNTLRAGRAPAKKGPRHLRLLELSEAIAHQAARTLAGDYTPVRRGLQPDYGKALDEMTKNRDALQRKLDEVTKDRDRLKTQQQRQADRRRSA